MSDWSQPKDVSDTDVVFPARVVGVLIPPREELPDEFRGGWHHNKWCKLAESLFFNGGKFPPIKAGIDQKKAWRQLRVILGSFEPQHEHKIGAAGYLMSLWCAET